MNDKISLKLKELPTDPGVYIMRDAANTVIYVGKARNLKNRVRSYFNSSVKTEKTMVLVSKIEDFDYIITNSEVDALVLENTLIKKHKPQYNILLKDDKLYPFLKINLKEKYPNVKVIRRLKADGSKYFGPYMIGITTRDMLTLLHSAFPIRWCDHDLDKLPKSHRTCLYHQMGKCLAPCVGAVTPEEYAKMINKIISFLQGEDKEIAEIIKTKMLNASDNLDFESALEYKKQLAVLEKMVRSQVVALPKEFNLVVFGAAFGDKSGAIACLSVRGGKVVSAEKYAIPSGFDDGDGISAFIYQFYSSRPMVADEIVTSFELEDALKNLLLAQKKVTFVCPKQGVRKQLADMADTNASEYLSRSEELITRKDKMTLGATAQLAKVLGIEEPLFRIECYDISNIQGTDKVSSMVVFEGGEKAAKMYRHFKIKTVQGANDFASMKETIDRRLKRLKEGKEESFKNRPDLIIIDGGLGQVGYALQAMEENGFTDIHVIGLAKREETIVLPDGKEINLQKDSYALRLIQRIRDEAHRFAITFHRKLRFQRTLESKLKEVEGIGDASVKKLYAHFKSFDAIKNASLEDLSKVVNKRAAQALYKKLHEE